MSLSHRVRSLGIVENCLILVAPKNSKVAVIENNAPNAIPISKGIKPIAHENSDNETSLPTAAAISTEVASIVFTENCMREVEAG